jgi:hypothetical protein
MSRTELLFAGSEPIPTAIEANKPIGVVSFHECAFVPDRRGSCDLLMTALPSVSNLDTFYILLPIGGRSNETGYVIQVVAYEDDTVVSTTLLDTDDSTLKAKEFVTFDLSFSEPTSVKCTRPCLVKQYNKHRIYDGKSDGFSLSVHGMKDFSSTLTFTLTQNMETYVSIVAHAPDVHPGNVINIIPTPFESNITWIEMKDVDGFYYAVVKMENGTGQRFIQSMDWKVTMSGYLAVHHPDFVTAWGLPVNTLMKGGSSRSSLVHHCPGKTAGNINYFL